MRYQVNPQSYHNVFVLPRQVVEKHLKLAGALQLKVLLWIYAHDGVCEDPAMIGADLGADPTDVSDALQYWLHNQIVITDDPAETAKPAVKAERAAVVAPPQTAPARQKPTRADVARRGSESPELAWLLQQAQSKLNRTLSFNESATLIWIADTCDLSPAVIMMIIEYAASLDKCNMRFIESTALQWAKNEVNTVEKAEQYLIDQERVHNDWNRVCHVFGLERRKPSKQEEIYCQRWLRDWTFSDAMLKAAYDECVNHTGKVSMTYINKVLTAWHNSGFTKPQDAQAAGAKTKKSGVKVASQRENKSYDIDEIEEFILNN